jgi:hypothetical protein
MAYYLFLADRHGTGSGSRWAIMGLAVKTAQSVCYHRFIFRTGDVNFISPDQIGLRGYFNRIRSLSTYTLFSQTGTVVVGR